MDIDTELDVAIAAKSAPVGVEDKAREMFTEQADKLAAPWERQWEPTKELWRRRAKEALDQQPSVAPEGMVLVPREPTQAMLYALAHEWDSAGRRSMEENYAAMLAAAQQEPTT